MLPLPLLLLLLVLLLLVLLLLRSPGMDNGMRDDWSSC